MQCEFILLASAQLDESVGPDGRRVRRDENAANWMALQTIAVSAANLSKLFWGSAGGKEATRKPLRDGLGIADDSLLRLPRLRNDFEHFDERIERRFKEVSRRGYVGRYIGPDRKVGRMLDGDPEPPDSRFGNYDPTTTTLSFWGNSINVTDITEEARRILGAIEAEAAKPFDAE